MKKLLLFIIVLTFSLSTAFAHEIEFRNMDWLISLEDFENALTAEGISFKHDITYVNHGYTQGSWSCFAGIEPWWYYEKIPQYCKRYKSTNDDYLCSAGGYEVSAIDAEFLPHHNPQTGYIYTTGGVHCDLVRASYQLYGKKTSGGYVELEVCYQDMVSKLQLVYGTPSGTEKNYGGGETTFWHKDDGSAVSVTITYAGLNGWVMIDYAWTLEKDYVMQLNEIITQQDALEVSSNLDGL